ncbi:Fungal specific transcription factor domain-containing protein [Cladophialophora immunda]|nr:Fungal specific transcription factor domain-containing protein [Cladophialophora immunda]
MAAYDPQTFWSRADKYLMNTGAPYTPVIITKAKGTYIYDANGREIIDFTSGQMSASLGHSHPEIVEVVKKYVGELDHLNSTILSPPVVDLATKFAQILPAPLEKSYFLSTGSESVEAAINIAKRATGKFEIVAFSASYHGSTQGAASATYCMGRKHGSPVIPGQLGFPAPHGASSPFRNLDGSYDWETEMDYGWTMIDAQSVGSLAAFVAEPILSAGGIIEPPKGYLKRLATECWKRGMLFIADEAQTGLGRTGDMFAFQRDEGLVPDILALSKSLGCGLALSAVSTTAEIAERAVANGFLWVTTHQNDPLPAAVGCKVLDIVQRDGLVQAARDRGHQLREGLLRLKSQYWCIGELRGRGLLQGIEIIADPITKAQSSELGLAISTEALKLGLSCQIVSLPRASGIFRVAPPLTVSAEEIAKALSILERAIATVLFAEPYRSVATVAAAGSVASTRSKRGRKPRSRLKTSTADFATNKDTIPHAAIPVADGDDPKATIPSCRGQVSATHTLGWLDDRVDLELLFQSRVQPTTPKLPVTQLDTQFLHQELTYASLVDTNGMQYRMDAALTPQSLTDRSQASATAPSPRVNHDGLPDFVKPLPQSLTPDDISYLRLKGALDLPPTSFLQALIEAHIQFVHPYMPTIDLSTIRGVLSGDNASIGILPLQAMIFASVPFVDIAEIQRAGFSSRRSCRKTFYERTRLLYDHDVESEKLATIQAVLLMAYWSEYPGDNRGAWYWMGIAITLGQILGMHRKAEYKIKSQESKIRKRIWWSCYIRDHMLAIAMGRPLRIREAEFNTPPLTLEDFDIIDLSDLSGGTLPTVDDQIALAQMCIRKTELCKLSTEVLDLHFSVFPSETSTSTTAGDNGFTATMMFLKDFSPSEQLVQNCDEELQTWYRNLPSSCVYRVHDGRDGHSPCLRTNAASLHITFWSVVSALHRPQLRNTNKALSLKRVEQAAVEVSRIDREMHTSRLDRYLPATAGVPFQITTFIIHTKRLENYKTGEVPAEILESLFFCIKVLETSRESFPGGDAGGDFISYIAKTANITVLFNQELKFWGVEYRGAHYSAGSSQLDLAFDSFGAGPDEASPRHNLLESSHTNQELPKNGRNANHIDQELPSFDHTDPVDGSGFGDILPVFDMDYDHSFAALVNVDYLQDLDMIG